MTFVKTTSESQMYALQVTTQSVPSYAHLMMVQSEYGKLLPELMFCIKCLRSIRRIRTSHRMQGNNQDLQGTIFRKWVTSNLIWRTASTSLKIHTMKTSMLLKRPSLRIYTQARNILIAKQYSLLDRR